MHDHDRTILVIDDDDDLRTALAEVLRDEGYDVVAARSGIDAIRCLDEGCAPCLILLDLMMPNMTGWEFMTRYADGRTGQIPVIVMTAYPVVTTPGRAVMVLRKPFDLRVLLHEVRRYIA